MKTVAGNWNAGHRHPTSRIYLYSPHPRMFLPSRHYVSPHTLFIRELLARKPELVEDQRKGRAIWWDKEPRDLADRAAMDEGRVAQPPYVYQTK